MINWSRKIRKTLLEMILIPSIIFVGPMARAQYIVFDPQNYEINQANLQISQASLEHETTSWIEQLQGMVNTLKALGSGNLGIGSVLGSPVLNQLTSINKDIEDATGLLQQVKGLRATYGDSSYKDSDGKDNAIFEQLAFINSRLTAIKNKDDPLKDLLSSVNQTKDVNGKLESNAAINGQVLTTLNELQQVQLAQQKAEAGEKAKAQLFQEKNQKLLDDDWNRIRNGGAVWPLKK